MVGNSIFVTQDFYVTVDIFVKSDSLLIEKTEFAICKRNDDSIFLRSYTLKNAVKACLRLQRLKDNSEGKQ